MPRPEECEICQRNQQRCDSTYGYWLGYKNALRAVGKKPTSGLSRADRQMQRANRIYEEHRKAAHPKLAQAISSALTALGALNQGEASTQREIDAARILRIALDGAT